MTDITRSTSQWIKFFRDAGLPANVSANYAIIFSDNRINLDMLMDLSKDYLHDMGIRLTGDVIAILKHAKEYHNELAKEKMMLSIDPSQQKKSTPTSRILSRLTKPPPSSAFSRLSLPRESPAVMQANKRAYPNTYSPVVPPSHSAYVNTQDVKKIRRTLSEDEGAYKVKLPLGNTERSRQILKRRQQLLQLKKRTTVFDRLGDSAVSSTTDVDKKRVMSSLFDSGVSNDVSSTISFGSDKYASLSSQPLQYQGVLKKTTINLNAPRFEDMRQKIIAKTSGNRFERTVYNSSADLQASNLRKINTILAQNAEEQRVANLKKSNVVVTRRLSGNNPGLSKTMLQRLGSKSGTIQLKAKPTISSRLGLRLGEQKQKTVFDRLGK